MTIGFWIVPVVLTVFGIIHSAHSIRHNRSSYGLDVIPLLWVFGLLIAWMMYLLSFLFG